MRCRAVHGGGSRANPIKDSRFSLSVFAFFDILMEICELPMQSKWCID